VVFDTLSAESLVPVAASSEVADILVDLFVVLLAAKLGDELFRRLHQPTLIGEILAGVIVGPSVIGIVEPGEVLEAFAEIGVVLLLFWAGLESRLSEMRQVGKAALSVGLLGLAIPFAGGLGVALALGESSETALFIAAALMATSAGITTAVMKELGVLGTRASRTILGAAIVDDILALILLSVAVGVAAEGGINVVDTLVVSGIAVAFVLFIGLGGTQTLQRAPHLMEAPRFAESPLLPAVLLCLGLAALSAQIGLAAIVGAFLAGMIVAETKEQNDVESEIAPLYAFFPPFFFVFIGANVDLGELANAEALGILAFVTVVAVATKYVGAWLGALQMGRAEARFVGAGMVPRGEVGIVVAGIGVTEGVVGPQLFAVIVGMAVLTTVIAPPVLRRLARSLPPDPEPAAPD